MSPDTQHHFLGYLTFVESVHIQLPNEGGHVCVLEVLSVRSQPLPDRYVRSQTHESTFENSAEGDMTKLSLLFDQEIRLDMLLSSSML